MATRQTVRKPQQAEKTLAIDIVCGLPDPERQAQRKHDWITWGDRVHRPERPEERGRRGLTVEQLIEKMDRAGIQKAFLHATKHGSKYEGFTDHIPYEDVYNACRKYPDRFYGLAGIDPWEGMEGVKELEMAVKEMGFIGVHFYPHWFRMEPDHRKYYPFYAKCIELDIPVQMQVGHCLIYIKDRPPFRSVGRPILMDTIACDLPELKLVGIHTGWPWVEEAISVAWKHPNVYLANDAWAPRYLKPEFVHFINSWGQDKVLFGTNFSMIDNERAMLEIDALELKPEGKRKFLRENASRLYKLNI
ncbi:MAG: amidohydrolase [Chloroflexi bacterium]|nr:amidohydrolase [Chloroflexota bacterium]